MKAKLTLSLLAALVIFQAMASVDSFKALAIPCPPPGFPTHTLPATTIYKTRTYTPAAVGPWDNLGRLWWRTVSYNVVRREKNVSACYDGEWDRFWALRGQAKTVTIKRIVEPAVIKTEIAWSAAAPAGGLPPVFSESAGVDRLLATVDPPTVPGTTLVAGLALDFPNFGSSPTFQDMISALSPGYSLASTGFASLSIHVASLENLPPEASSFLISLAAVSSDFAVVGAQLSTASPQAGALSALDADLESLGANLSALEVCACTANTPHLSNAAGYVADAAAQVSAGLSSENEQLAFLEDLYLFGGSLKAFGASFFAPVGGIVDEIPDLAGTALEAGGSSGPSTGVLAGVIAGITAGAVALGGAAWYARRRLVR